MINDATAPIDRSRLIDDMTKQLERGGQLRYMAEYQLLGGQEATVAQQASPVKTVYRYPGGVLIVSESDQTWCDMAAKKPRCEIRALPASYAEPAKAGMITGSIAADLVAAAGLQPDATVKPHDTTIAGVPASCLEVLGLADAAASGFTVCVTADGVLASFSGVVNGLNVDLALTRLALRAPSAPDFALPDGADVVDLRQTASPASIG